MTAEKLAIIAGAGPGLGHALIRRMQDQGYKAVGLSRTANSEDGLDIRACDLTNADAVAQVVGGLIAQHGAPSFVAHNAAHLVIAPLSDTSVDDFEACWRNMVLSAAHLAKHVLDPMAQADGGSFIVSGATASLRGGAKFSAFASAKFALRGLTQSLAREFQPRGVHVVHTILDGIIDTPNSRSLHTMDPAKMMKPEDIAQVYWQLAQQPRSDWSHELDLRPQSEGF